MQKRLFPRLLRVLLGGGIALYFCFWLFFEPEAEQITDNNHVINENSEKINYPQLISNRTPANTVTQQSLPSVSAGISERVHLLEACIESRACNFPDTDPRAYDLAIGQKLAEEMRMIAEQSVTPSEEAVETARRLLLNPDGHVKAAALEVIAKSEPNPDVLAALLEGVLLEHDAKLLPRTLGILARYTDSASRARIDQTLQLVLTRGSHYVSLYLAQNLIGLLNSENISTYQSVLARLPAHDPVRELAERQIREYRLQSSGG